MSPLDLAAEAVVQHDLILGDGRPGGRARRANGVVGERRVCDGRYVTRNCDERTDLLPSRSPVQNRVPGGNRRRPFRSGLISTNARSRVDAKTGLS